MTNSDVIRAWKDEDYRMSLSADELELVPENPAGLVEFFDGPAALDTIPPVICTVISILQSCITICVPITQDPLGCDPITIILP